MSKSYFGDGSPPHVVGSSTSRAAAESICEIREKDWIVVLKEIRGAGSKGLTDDEIEVVTGFKHQTASARRRELELRGKVKWSGKKRPTRSGREAMVWVTSDQEVQPVVCGSERRVDNRKKQQAALHQCAELLMGVVGSTDEEDEKIVETMLTIRQAVGQKKWDEWEEEWLGEEHG